MPRKLAAQIQIDARTLMSRIHSLGDSARDDASILSRLALTDQDRIGRDLIVGWMSALGLSVSVDRIGNIFGCWCAEIDNAPLMIGSHIDSVVNAGIYDGCYGVLSGLAVVDALQAANVEPERPLVVAAFTNEEGARYAPDMMGSLVHAGGLDVDSALLTRGVDGSVLGEELDRIGYSGAMRPGTIQPGAYLELHIEQGPVLEAERVAIGAVENLQGISWQEITIKGVANHAGTTPTRMRHDAGLAASRIAVFLAEEITAKYASTVATIGRTEILPNVINVIPSKVKITVDLRDPDESRLQFAEACLADMLQTLEVDSGVSIAIERLARFEPVQFDPALVSLVEKSAGARGLSCRRMTSGAGHDAQMMARICPSAMVFVPSKDGISHNPREHTDESSLLQGASVLLDVALDLVCPD